MMNGKVNIFVNLITRELPGTWNLSERKEFGNGQEKRIIYAIQNSMAMVIVRDKNEEKDGKCYEAGAF